MMRPIRIKIVTRLVIAASILGGVTTAVVAADGPLWIDRHRTGPFVVLANFPLVEERQMFSRLEQLQLDLVRTTGIRPAQEQVELRLFAEAAQYRDHLQQVLPSVPFRRALYVKQSGTGTVYAFRSRDFAEDVCHETTHALLHASLPMVPLWLDEGLAEYFELPAHQRAFEHAHLAQLERWIRLRRITPLSELEQLGDLTEMGRREYRDAWAWVHFMLHGSPEAHQELVNYLHDLGRGVPPGKLSQRIARRLPNADERIAAHFSGWSTRASAHNVQRN